MCKLSEFLCLLICIPSMEVWLLESLELDYLKILNRFLAQLTNGVQINPVISFSFIKCLSISNCLVLSCWTGLQAMLMVALLMREDKSPHRLDSDTWHPEGGGIHRPFSNHQA